MKNVLRGALVLLALGTTTSFAMISDAKRITGASCKPIDLTHWDQVQISATGLANIGTQGVYVACALPTDGESEDESVELTVAFRAGASAAPVTCTAFSGDYVAGWSSSVRTATVAPNATAQLQWTLQRGPQTPLGFLCKLPPQFKLGRVTLVEHVPTTHYK